MSQNYSTLEIFLWLSFLCIGVYTGEPGPTNFLSGTVDVSDTQSMFWWMRETDSSDLEVPTILFFEGGPGACSELMDLLGIGPDYFFTNGLERNNQSWTRFANVLFIDTPSGTGFSTGPCESTDEEVADHHLIVLEHLFKNELKHLKNNRLWLIGYSYGPHYVIYLSKLLVQLKPTWAPELGGIGLGAPFICGGEMIIGAFNLWYNNGFIPYPQKLQLDSIANQMQQAQNDGDFESITTLYFEAEEIWSNSTSSVDLDPYYNWPMLNYVTTVEFINTTFREQANLPIERPFNPITYNSTYYAMNSSMWADITDDLSYLIQQKVYVFIYSGLKDMDIPYITIEKCLQKINGLDEISQLQYANRELLTLDPTNNIPDTYLRKVDNLSFYQFPGAGHTATMKIYGSEVTNMIQQEVCQKTEKKNPTTGSQS